MKDPAGPRNDEGFGRFYNTFESLFSKLSAPLAFAGLPLNPDSDTTAPALPGEQRPKTSNTVSSIRSKSTNTRPSSRATVEPEYSRLFSPATLAAVREEPGNANLGAAESFYVVPTTGGTMPYASILARRQNQHRSSRRHHDRTLSRDSIGLSEDLDEFVDARETPGPPSPQASRKSGGEAQGLGVKSMEELQLENETLHGILDEMSRRLWQFECGAQMGSVALQQSIRASMNRTGGGHGSPAASDAGTAAAAGGPKALEGRVAGLEDELGRMKRDLERSGRENEKLKGVVGRYRERWEKLKEGARTRRVTGGIKDGGGGGEQLTEAGDA